MKTLTQKLKHKFANKRLAKITPLFALFFFFISTQKAYADSVLGNFIVDAVDATVGNLAQGIGFVLEYISRFIVFLGAQFLDLAISFSLNTANLKMPAITETWTIARDVTNMIFIFILLYIGIMLILRFNNFTSKKILTNLVIAGLLINFSFFLTGVVIDIGNITGGMLYKAMTPTVTVKGKPVQKNIGGVLINNMNLTMLNQPILQENSTSGDLDSFKLAIRHLSNAILFTVAGFAFFAGGFIFIIRQIVLMFVLILSPLAFAAIILPRTKKYWDMWVDALIHNTFVAPIYLLLVAFVLMISGSGGFAAATQNGVTDYSNAAGVTKFGGELLSASDIILQYTLIIGMMIASVIVAKNISSGTAKMAVTMSNKLMGAGVGVGAAVGRRSIGRGARAFSNSELVKRGQAYSGVGSSFVNYGSRKAMETSGAIGKSSMDVRDTPLAKIPGVNIGKAGGKGGYDAIRKGQVTQRKDVADKLEKVSKTEKEQEDINYLHELKREARQKGDTVAVKAHEDAIKVREGEIKQRGIVRKEIYTEKLSKRGIFSTARAQTAANKEASDEIRSGPKKKKKKP